MDKTTVIIRDKVSREDREIQILNPGNIISVDGKKYRATQEYFYGKQIYVEY